MKRRLIYLLSVLFLMGLLLPGCPDLSAPPEITGLVSLKVELLSEAGTAAEPLQIAGGERGMSIRISALDAQGNVMSGYEAPVKISARNAFLGRNGWVEETVTGGQEVEVTLKRGFGSMRFLVQDQDNLVVGVSEPFYLPEPTLNMVQTPTGNIEGSPWSKHFVHVATGTLVVTYVALDGFYVTDVDSDTYNSMYVYTHGIPFTDRGDVLAYLSGTVDEYYGLTEMSFPDYDVKCHYHPSPAVTELTRTIMSDDNQMESLESSLVSVNDLKIYRVDDNDYLNYGQWVGRTGEGTDITMISRNALPEFDPRTSENRQQTFTQIVGILRQHWSAKPEWILVPRDECDIWGVGERPERCDEPMPESTCETAD